MRLASLYSGGKDSTYAVFKAKELGHEISCLLTMYPESQDSMLFHYPNGWITRYLGEAMNIPTIGYPTGCGTSEEELNSLEKAIIEVKSLYNIEGVVHGGIQSKYQNDIFGRICSRHKLATLTPIWQIQQSMYMELLLETNFEIKIVGVSSMGLDEKWLGISLDREALNRLKSLSNKYRFNLTFEGGEGETLVLDCPIFYKRVVVRKANIHWDGQRGMFEIQEIALVQK
ncbi:MAG TPA: diphthine--ammonia ligase [Candidatus Nitrosopolaris sp.]|nr:diphthine--ammonia ligase [Candidatus Nitrosopolaris sp.]